MEDIFRLRYEVYCAEKRFLDADDYPEEMEMDEFDENAVHLVVHGRGDEPMGYMRVIDGTDESGYPMFFHGMSVYDDFLLPPAGEALEISRMIVRSDYRHEFRAVDDGFNDHSPLPRPRARNASDLVQLKLLRLTYRQALQTDARWIYAAMEPTLHRKFRMMGMPFGPIGPSADYYGEVRPYAMDIRNMEAVLGSRFPETLDFFGNPEEDPDCTVIAPEDWTPRLRLPYAA